MQVLKSSLSLSCCQKSRVVLSWKKQCMAHFGCRRAQTIWNNWQKSAQPSVVRTRGQKLMEIGQKSWWISSTSGWIGYVPKHRINKNEIWNNSWPNSCLKRDFGGVETDWMEFWRLEIWGALVVWDTLLKCRKSGALCVFGGRWNC